jgi:pantoate kinase
MTFFAPASITCFFSTVIKDDPLLSGSVGVGITLNVGVKAKVSKSGIRVNGQQWEFPTVQYVIEKLGCDAGVEISMDVPAGCGFGMSGASALSTAFELNRAFNLGKSFLQLADIAHEAEVVSRTGLGDVVCQSYGGVVVRKTAASPSKSIIDRFLWDYELDFLVMGSISTEEVLKDDKIRERINRTGRKCLSEFLKKPSLENLFDLSKKFSIETGLMDDDLVDVVEAVEADGGKASMVMLGKAVFAYNGFNALKEFGEPFRATIDPCGVRFCDF